MQIFMSLARGCAAMVFLVSTAGSFAMDWPTKPVRIVVGFPSGSNSDIIARELAEPLAKVLGQPVIVDPRPGAGGNIGTQAVASAAPDGYTLLLATNGTQAINPSLYQNLPFDTEKDFAPISLICDIPNILIVNKDFPPNNLHEFMAYVKSHPDQVNYASSGNGGAMHLAGEQFKLMAKVDMTHVPYKGSPPAMTDLMAGRVQAMFQLLPAVVGRVGDGSFKVIGVASKARISRIPDVPTLSESGLPGFESTSWYALYAPAKTPPEIVDRLNLEVARVMNEGLSKRLMTLGVVPRLSTPNELRSLLKNDMPYWRNVLKQTGAKID
ncbi:tripartite tricarboxylate transporter substrate binding protein [Variovorax sp. J22P271]|uniref:Bug family tripartite tricarboxylate transporter substrate binding protein n=1 Tax=Variovorax davisae TaxID=3053515 RepID=UPI002574E563|nr:tripartite tricarboxylate transporter substrate binding protein [Variovorax sp. J22P271]MDM0035937.1 tripartite tricarboxylate transporter substrate binding protein [Variovorax sp. J22P271]